VESIEGLCEKMLEYKVIHPLRLLIIKSNSSYMIFLPTQNYKIHKERTDSSRFAKEVSQTFKTLHGLV